MKKIILLISLLPLSAIGDVINSSPELQGIEQLMAGVGLARIGSQGSMTANPSLLAFLLKKQEFLSVNKLNIYKSEGSEVNTKTKTEVIPSYAVTTEGFGNWGHSYGLGVQSYKLDYQFTVDDQATEGMSEREFITLGYGFGKKIDETSSWGASLILGRDSAESRGISSGKTGGLDYLVSGRYTTTAWVLGSTLGASKIVGEYVFGLSAKLGLSTFGVSSQQRQITHIEGQGINTENTSNIPYVKVLPSAGLGVQRKFALSSLYLDVNYNPSYEDQDTSNKALFTYGVGYETLTFMPKIQFYSGLRYAPKVSQDQNAVGMVSSGFSKKGKHSTSFFGLNWSRDLLKPTSEIIGIIFGTKFEY